MNASSGHGKGRCTGHRRFAHIREGLDGFDEFDHRVAVVLAQRAELLDRPAGVALRRAMPHDSLDDRPRTAIVQAVAGARALLAQATAPERRRTAPARADVVHHEEPVLHHVGVGPDQSFPFVNSEIIPLSAFDTKVESLVESLNPKTFGKSI